MGQKQDGKNLTAIDVKNRRRPKMKDVGRDPMTGRNIQHEYDPKVATQIAEWVGNGADINDIALALDLRPGTIKKHYGLQLKTGVFQSNMEVASAMKQLAKGDAAAGKFWLKARAGWKDGENSGQQTSPLQINIHT